VHGDLHDYNQRRASHCSCNGLTAARTQTASMSSRIASTHSASAPDPAVAGDAVRSHYVGSFEPEPARSSPPRDRSRHDANMRICELHLTCPQT
jgi:hypothetical protein